MGDRVLAPVVDLAAYRRLRNDARHKIIRAANQVRLRRVRYVSVAVRYRETVPPKLLTMRNLNEAVSIVRHWGSVDEGTLAAAGFAGRKLARPAPVEGRRAA